MSTVLVIEDTLTDVEILAGCLRQEGLQVITARSSEEASEKIERQKPDAIVLDVVLPGRSGYELCRQLKSQNTTSDIPIVMCSTKDSDIDRFWGIKQGADAFLPKPIDKDELVRTVKKLIRF
jgi:DNA-binding response OmpR family regulator